MDTLPPRYVVCDNDACIHVGLLRPVYPVRIGTDLHTYPPATCACRPDIELRWAPKPLPWSDPAADPMKDMTEAVQTAVDGPERSWLAKIVAPNGYADPVLNQRVPPMEVPC